jgi:hypothetical protein
VAVEEVPVEEVEAEAEVEVETEVEVAVAGGGGGRGGGGGSGGGAGGGTSASAHSSLEASEPESCVVCCSQILYASSGRFSFVWQMQRSRKSDAWGMGRRTRE